ncbi:MAG: ECF-type sigma factor [Pirellulales bacterium]|nr:ECF-type sigma factor [Pirellulales bacterium]
MLRSFAGDHEAEADLCEAVNQQLRRAAARLVRRYHASARPSSLVNEVFVAMFRGRPITPENREHFFAIATEQMRQLLRERWRRAGAKKRGGHLNRLHLNDIQSLVLQPDQTVTIDFELLDRELNRLRNTKSTRLQYKIIKYRFFGGLTVQETAELLSLSKTVVEREWRLARAKLRQRLESE